MTKDQLEYFNGYLDRCWEARQYYKDETNKLLYWVGTCFVAIVGATGLFGANQTSRYAFEFKHILVFHAVFAVVWFYYLYKQLNADMFEKLGILLESHLRRELQLNRDWDFQGYFGLKGHYLGRARGHGRSLTRYANIGIMLIYISVTCAPLFRGSVSLKSINLNWDFLAVAIICPLLITFGRLSYARNRKRVLEEIERDWRQYVNFDEKGSIPRPTTLQ